jgi:predicted MPP superfamily phosphohydrolase
MTLRSAVRSLRGLNDWRLWTAGIVTAFGIAIVEANAAWTPPARQPLSVVELAIYWGLWLLWPLALLLLLRMLSHTIRGRWLRAVASAFLLAVTVGFVWARFFEPYRLEVHETSVGTACGVRVALVSDLHIGLFTRNAQLEQLVTQLNALDVDAVLVAGDWSYEPKRDLRAAFAPWAGLRHPSYGVLGNHDEANPGPTLQQPLRTALQANGVQLIEGRRVVLGRCELVGLGDLSAGSVERDLKALAANRSTRPVAQRVVLTHNPDTVYRLGAGFAAVTLAGHTHGGQIDLPLLTDRVLGRLTRGAFRRGLYPLEMTKLFVTGGIGTDYLPLRFRVPPAIDVIAL